MNGRELGTGAGREPGGNGKGWSDHLGQNHSEDGNWPQAWYLYLVYTHLLGQKYKTSQKAGVYCPAQWKALWIYEQEEAKPLPTKYAGSGTPLYLGTALMVLFFKYGPHAPSNELRLRRSGFGVKGGWITKTEWSEERTNWQDTATLNLAT